MWLGQLTGLTEQYELMQLAYAVGKDFTGKEDLVGAKYSKLLKLEIFPDGHGKVIFLAADMCGSPRPRAGGMLLGSLSHTHFSL